MVRPQLNLGPTLKTLNISLLWLFQRLGLKTMQKCLETLVCLKKKKKKKKKTKSLTEFVTKKVRSLLVIIILPPSHIVSSLFHFGMS